MTAQRTLGAVRAALCLILLLVMTGCATGNGDESGAVRRLVYGLTLSPSGFDPHVNQSSEMGIVLRQVYDTLVYRHPETGRFVAGLAESWTISEDQTIYTFVLRQNVTFHDGTPFNAQAVAANLNRITNPETRSQNALFLLGNYAGYTIIDNQTIEIRLSEPFAPLLDSLSQFYLGMASPSALETYGNERYQFNQVGTGPYRFVEYVPDSHLLIRRNPDYAWGPEFYAAPAQNAIEEVEFRFFRDAATRLTALEQGTVQIMGDIPPADARVLTGNSAFRIVTAQIAGQPDQLLINTQNAPTDNPSFRQAVMLAINRRAIVDALYQGFSPLASGPLTRNSEFYADMGENRYPFDPQQARALLSTLGYVDTDNDGFWDTVDGNIRLTMIVPPWGEYRQIAQLLQDQLGVVGIRLETVSVPDFPTLLSEVEKGTYHFVPFNSYGVDPAFLATYYSSTGSRNFAQVSDTTLDALLGNAVRDLNPAARAELYRQAQTTIMDAVLMIPLRERVNLNGVSNAVEGLSFDTYGWYPILYNASYAP